MRYLATWNALVIGYAAITILCITILIAVVSTHFD